MDFTANSSTRLPTQESFRWDSSRLELEPEPAANPRAPEALQAAVRFRPCPKSAPALSSKLKGAVRLVWASWRAAFFGF